MLRRSDRLGHAVVAAALVAAATLRPADAAETMHDGETVLDGAYDREMPIVSKDGSSVPEALKISKQSWVDMKILPSVPGDDQILTRRFVPVKVQTAVSP